MKCYFCNSESDILTTDGRCICSRCTEQRGLVVCLKKGMVIANPEFHCDNICNDCIYEEDIK